MKSLLVYLPRFVEDLRAQLERDEQRWGDTWVERGREGQEERFIAWIEEKIRLYNENGMPIPWLKIAGEVLIGWVRETQRDWKE